jgi:murein DD-endopeptidase MepM/ murein hydrolase activator NlpD
LSETIFRIRVACALLLAAAVPLAAAAAQAPDNGLVEWSPRRPRQGTLFRLFVDGVADPRTVSGTIADEPLHFAPAGVGRVSALAPVPIDAARALTATIVIADELGTDTVRARVPVAPGGYPSERLTVAPRFTGRPDTALRRRMEDEARRAAAVARAAHDTPRLWSAPFQRPRPGRVTSGFGRARVFNGAVQSRHMGIDFAGAVGAPVRAANRGVVRLVDEFYLGGNVVYIDHGAGLVTAYLHLSETAVAAGDTVERGALIGRVGATGRVTGPHLHFIARYGQYSVDPLTLLQMTRPPAPPASPAGARSNGARAR